MYDKAKIWSEDVKDVVNSLRYSDKIASACEIYNLVNNDTEFRSKLAKSDLHEFLNCLWQYLLPDTAKRKDNSDEASQILQLHLVSLKILHLSNLPGTRSLIDSSMVSPNAMSSIIDFINLSHNPGNPHAECCSQASTYTNWQPEAITFCRDTLVGHVFKCVLEESNSIAKEGKIYNAILYDNETTEDIVDILSKHALIFANNLAVNLDSNLTTTECVKVTHVVTPEYVYVQLTGDLEDLEELKQEMKEYLDMAPIASAGDTDVIVKLDEFLFRAEVLCWGDKSAQVFAIDYGWKAEIPVSRLYQADENIMELPSLAKLCRLININPHTTNTKIQYYAVKLLQTFAAGNEKYSTAILNSPNISEVLKAFKTTRNADIMQALLLLISQLCFHAKVKENTARMFMNSVVSCLRKWFLHSEVVSIGLECLRNMVVNRCNLSINENFIERGGLELTFKAFTSYTQDSTIKENSLHILKFCLKGFEFEVPSAELDSLEVDNLTLNTPKTSLFSHLHNMSEYKIHPCSGVSFLEDIMKSTDTAKFAREVVAHLNTVTGGVIYIGVTPKGLLNGLKLNRLRKDDYRVKIDSVLRKMICNYRQVELPGQLFECNFELIKNEHGRALPEDVEMYLLILHIAPSPALARVTVDTTIFWKRDYPGNSVPMSANEIRQQVANYIPMLQQTTQ